MGGTLVVLSVFAIFMILLKKVLPPKEDGTP